MSATATTLAVITAINDAAAVIVALGPLATLVRAAAHAGLPASRCDME